MKTSKILAVAALGILGVIGANAQETSKCSAEATCTKAQSMYVPGLIGGPGLVVSESASQNQLPQAAQDFLQTYYSRVMVGPINHNVIKDTYNVELGNGVKITFNGKGQVEDIKSEGTDPLYEPAIKAVLPEKAYTHLKNAGLLPEVTGIKNARGRGLSVQLLNAMPPQMLFDVDGVFIILDD